MFDGGNIALTRWTILLCLHNTPEVAAIPGRPPALGRSGAIFSRCSRPRHRL